MNIERINEITAGIMKAKSAIDKIEKLAKKLINDSGELNIKLSVEMPSNLSKEENTERVDRVIQSLETLHQQVIFSAAGITGREDFVPRNYSAPAKNGFEQDYIPNKLALIMLQSMITYYNQINEELHGELINILQPKQIHVTSCGELFNFPE